MINILNISKKFNKTDALTDVSFDVNDGEIVGLLGENGAGKSTLLRIISTMLLPTSGTAKVNGYDIVQDSKEVRKSIGILFGSEVGLYERLTARENIEYFAMLNGMSKEDCNNRINYLMERFSFGDYVNRALPRRNCPSFPKT